MIAFREAHREDVPAVVALIADDVLGAGRETGRLADYFAAFDRMADEPGNLLVVGVVGGEVVATYQMSVVSGLSLGATRRATVESVRVTPYLRGRGIGAALMADAEDRARAMGCALVQLTSNRSRVDAHRFYERLGYAPSHVGFKKAL